MLATSLKTCCCMTNLRSALVDSSASCAGNATIPDQGAVRNRWRASTARRRSTAGFSAPGPALNVSPTTYGPERNVSAVYGIVPAVPDRSANQLGPRPRKRTVAFVYETVVVGDAGPGVPGGSSVTVLQRRRAPWLVRRCANDVVAAAAS